MRGLIHRACPPRESVLQAAELEMSHALAEARRCELAGDREGYVKHMARLHALVEQAAELVGRAA